MEFKYKVGDIVLVDMDELDDYYVGVVLNSTTCEVPMYAVGFFSNDFEGHSCEITYNNIETNVPKYFENKCWWCLEDEIIDYAKDNRVVM